VGAIETGRLVPSAAAALALAAALECRVEDLFQLDPPAASTPEWAWPPAGPSRRCWRAEIGGVVRLYPVEPASSPMGHDGVFDGSVLRERSQAAPGRTLVLAGCDPAAGMLAEALARAAGVRLLAFTRSSRAALDLLGRGLVHVAGLHLAGEDDPTGNARVVREALGPGYSLVRVVRWEEGIAHAPSARLSSVAGAVRSRLRWVGREPGSGARQCLDELLAGRTPPRRLASDHRGVAEAVRAGWADAGVCLRLAGEEAGLGFLPVRREDYDLCFPDGFADDPRLRALLDVLRSASHREALGDLPGYDSRMTGELLRAD